MRAVAPSAAGMPLLPSRLRIIAAANVTVEVVGGSIVLIARGWIGAVSGGQKRSQLGFDGGKAGFKFETALKEIIIPEGVTSLDEHSFSDCRVLEKVHLPATLKSIGKLAFNFTPKLKEIQCEATVPPTLGEQSFEKAGVYNDQGGKITLKVPEASADAYKNASQWKKFEVNP